MKKTTNLVDSFRFALEGIYFVVRKNRNMRIHIVAAFLAISLSYILKITIFEACLVGIAILLVIVAEMINTVVEETVNLITKEYKVEAKIAKDVSAGVVLGTATASVIIGIVVFLPHLVKIFAIIPR